jgi:hypothetical protein
VGSERLRGWVEWKVGGLNLNRDEINSKRSKRRIAIACWE